MAKVLKQYFIGIYEGKVDTLPSKKEKKYRVGETETHNLEYERKAFNR
jgi:hypothetical protein